MRPRCRETEVSVPLARNESRRVSTHSDHAPCWLLFFLEYWLDSQPLNLNNAFHEESEAQSATGKLLLLLLLPLLLSLRNIRNISHIHICDSLVVFNVHQ